MIVTLLAAVSIDMFISPKDQQRFPSTSWTSKEDRAFFVKKSKEISVMLMGANTFQTINRALPERLTIVITHHPDQMETTFLDKHQLTELPENLRFTNQGVEEIISSLEREGYVELALCGGASLYSQFLRANLVDRLFLTLEPIIFGEGVALFSQLGEKNLKLKLLSEQKLNETGTLVLEYQVEK